MTEQSEKSEQFSLVEEPDLKNGLRVRPVQFASIMGISKGRVSQLIKDGTIKVGVDGMIDLNKAVKSYFSTIDLKKVRNRLLRPIADDLEAIKAERDELQKQVGKLKDELASLEKDADELDEMLCKEYAESIEREKNIEQFINYLAIHFAELHDCDDPRELLRFWWVAQARDADELFSQAEGGRDDA